jgi:type VI secretion system protein ImpJ
MQSTAVRVLPPDAVLWHEGMLLAPQHFQQSTLRGEELLHYRLSAAAPFAWGVRRLQVDRQQLVDGVFRLTQLEAVLPDGTVAAIDPERPLEIPLTDNEEDARRGTLTVHLCVAAARAPGEPFKGQLTRFDRVEGPEVLDDLTGDGGISIPRLRPRLCLVATVRAPDGAGRPGRADRPDGKFVSIPLARVRYRDSGYFLAGFIPPLLAVDPDAPPSAPLAAMCADIAARLREKALYFAERLGSGRGRPGDVQAMDLHAHIQALVGELPRLEALVGLRGAHPLELYLALCGLAGRLAGLEGSVPNVFPAYDHNDLAATFEPLRAFCTRALDRLQQAFAVVSFEWSDGLYQTPLAALPADGTPLLVGVRGGAMGEAQAIAWMEECRIGSRSRMASLAERRFRGAARRRAAGGGDQQMAGGAGVVLFEVAVDPEHLAAGEPLQVAHPDGERRERPAELVLYTRTSPAKQV